MPSLVFFPKHVKVSNAFLYLGNSVFTASQVAKQSERDLLVVEDGFHVGFELKFDCTATAVKVKTPVSLGLGGVDIYVSKTKLLALWAHNQAALQDIPVKIAFLNDECMLISEKYLASLVAKGYPVIDSSMLVEDKDLEPGDVIYAKVGTTLETQRSVVLAKSLASDGSGDVEVWHALLKSEDYVPPSEECLVSRISFGANTDEACALVEPRKYVDFADKWGPVMQNIIRMGIDDTVRYWNDIPAPDRRLLEQEASSQELHSTPNYEEVSVESLLNLDTIFTEEMLKCQLETLGYIYLPSITVYDKTRPYYSKLSFRKLTIFKHAGKSRYYLRWGIEAIWKQKNKGLSTKNLTLDSLAKMLIAQYKETYCLVRKVSG
jgi:hypothetical protein